MAACIAAVAVVAQDDGPTIAGATSFDPEGDGHEREDLVGNAIDGDPETAWTSERYDDPVALAGGKDGFGLVIELAGASDLSQVSVDTAEGGWSARVYAADAPGDDLESWGEPLASVADASTGTTTFAVDASGVREVMVWFTQVAPSGLVSVSDVAVRA